MQYFHKKATIEKELFKTASILFQKRLINRPIILLHKMIVLMNMSPITSNL